MTSEDEAVDEQYERRAAVLSELVEDRATVLVGDEGEQWDFPLEMLPEHVEIGTYLLVEMLGGRPVSVFLNEENEQIARKGMDARLERLARYEHLTGTEVRIG